MPFHGLQVGVPGSYYLFQSSGGVVTTPHQSMLFSLPTPVFVNEATTRQSALESTQINETARS